MGGGERYKWSITAKMNHSSMRVKVGESEQDRNFLMKHYSRRIKVERVIFYPVM